MKLAIGGACVDASHLQNSNIDNSANHFMYLYSFLYRAFHRFGQAKFPDGGLVLNSSQFSILPQLPLKTMLSLKVVKFNS